MVFRTPTRRLMPAQGEQPQVSAEMPGREEDPDMDDAYWQAHETLSSLESSQASEHADLHMVHAFGAPKEWRTMSRVPLSLVHLLAGIHARGLRNGSRFRTSLVENYFLMMRSADGYGSEQMVKVASARTGVSVPPADRPGMFSGWLPKKGP